MIRNDLSWFIKVIEEYVVDKAMKRKPRPAEEDAGTWLLRPGGQGVGHTLLACARSLQSALHIKM